MPYTVLKSTYNLMVAGLGHVTLLIFASRQLDLLSRALDLVSRALDFLIEPRDENNKSVCPKQATVQSRWTADFYSLRASASYCFYKSTYD